MKTELVLKTVLALTTLGTLMCGCNPEEEHRREQRREERKEERRAEKNERRAEQQNM